MEYIRGYAKNCRTLKNKLLPLEVIEDQIISIANDRRFSPSMQRDLLCNRFSDRKELLDERFFDQSENAEKIKVVDAFLKSESLKLYRLFSDITHSEVEKMKANPGGDRYVKAHYWLNTDLRLVYEDYSERQQEIWNILTSFEEEHSIEPVPGWTAYCSDEVDMDNYDESRHGVRFLHENYHFAMQDILQIKELNFEIIINYDDVH